MSNFVLVSVQVLTWLSHLCNVQELSLLKKEVYFYCRLRILVHLISLFDSAARILRPNLRLGAGAHIGFILSIFISAPLLWLELSSSILVFTTYVWQIFYKSPNSLFGKKLCSCTHILCTAHICTAHICLFPWRIVRSLHCVLISFAFVGRSWPGCVSGLFPGWFKCMWGLGRGGRNEEIITHNLEPEVNLHSSGLMKTHRSLCIWPIIPLPNYL